MRRICLEFHEGTLDNIDADAIMSFVDNWSPAKPEATINDDDCNILWEDRGTGNKYHLHGPCRLFLLVQRPGRTKPDGVVIRSKSPWLMYVEPPLVELLNQRGCTRILTRFVSKIKINHIV